MNEIMLVWNNYAADMNEMDLSGIFDAVECQYCHTEILIDDAIPHETVENVYMCEDCAQRLGEEDSDE